MLKEFQTYLSQNLSFLQEKKLLIAVSGGIDSMVLVHLLHKLGYDIYMAHCNFNLRGEESDGDEKFIRDYADKNGIKLFVTNFDTNKYAAEYKVSIQIAARQLRYAWFNELLVENRLDHLLTAHHLDDSLETFLINFSRGTGLEGLTGIPQQNGNIVRPLLGFTRSEIETYVKENNIEWREDSSNASDKYLRNKLRHDVAPVLKSLNPAFMASFLETIEHLQQAQSMVEDASVLVYRQVVTEGDNQKHFSIDLLKRLPNYRAYMYQWLSPFGFTAWNDIYNLVDAQSGKQILSGEYRLLKDRDILILEPLKKMSQLIYEIAENTQKIEVPLSLLLQKVDETDAKPAINTIFVDAGQLKFPLFVRKWQEGDYFCPLGMNGQKKKVSKYFKDEKLSLSDKEDAWLLCSEDRIVWVINMRADERFKVTNKTTQILKIEV